MDQVARWRRSVRRGADRLRRAVTLLLHRTPAFRSVAVACAVCAVAAFGTAVVTGVAPQRAWGLWAGVGYLVAGALALVTRRPALGIRVAVVGAVLLPAVAFVAAGIWQPEVSVIERSAALLVNTGSPYSLHPVGTYDVTPYLPAMALFGLPRVLAGSSGLGDPRWWFLAVFVASFVAANRIAGRRRGTELVLWAVLACPVIAVQVATAGDDLAVVGLLCLSIALASRGRQAQAGLVLGFACAMKASAWPAAVVVAALVIALVGWRRGARFLGDAAVVVVGIALPVLVGPTARAMIAQAAGFPMAQNAFKSPADAPTPGVLLANGVPAMRLAGDALLVLAALALCAWLVVHPPRTAFRTAGTAAIALTVAALVLPTSRFGYVVYPVVFTVFALRSRRRGPDTGGPPASRGDGRPEQDVAADDPGLPAVPLPV